MELMVRVSAFENFQNFYDVMAIYRLPNKKQISIRLSFLEYDVMIIVRYEQKYEIVSEDGMFIWHKNQRLNVSVFQNF